jgi:hypothetical protein
MAWFRRNRNEEAAADTADPVAPGPADAEPAGAELAAETPPAAEAPQPPAAPPAWTTAPPMASVIPTIQRSLGRIEARSATTLGQPAPLLLAPLGHAVTPDAPAGVVGTTLAERADHDLGPAIHDQPPLDYVQRSRAGSVPGRPAAPAQLLVPSFQPAQLPRVPVAAPQVQRAAGTSAYTTAPDPTPPLVLPVGEVIAPPAAPPAAEMPPAAAPSTPAEAPLLAPPTASPAPSTLAASAPTPSVQRAPAADLPLAPVQRHADHPGHVDGDEAPEAAKAPEAADVQRAAVDAPSLAAPPPVAAPDAPLLADSPLLPAAPLPAASAPAAAEAAAPADLPLAPVQRHADHPGHVDGDEAPAEPAEVQRAAVDAPAPAPTAVTAAAVGDAPLVGDAPPLAGPLAPSAGGAVQAQAPDGPDAPVGPAADLPLPTTPVQRRSAPRRPVGLGAPITAVPTATVPTGATDPSTVQRAPLASPPAAPPSPTAPLVGQGAPPTAPLPPLAAVQRAADDDTAPGGAEAPPLDLVQRAPVEAGSASPPAPGETAPSEATEAGPHAMAPLVGETPLEPSIATAAAAGTASSPGEGTATSPSPGLELVQRAPLAPSGTGSSSSAAAAAGSSTSAATPAAAPLPPLVVAPLLGGRPFATQVQRAADSPASAPTGMVDRSSPEALSPEPGRLYQPLASIGMWNGAPPPDLPGPSIEAPPAHIASAVQRATGADVSNTRIRRDTGPTAQRLEARALTHEGEVHIPASVGSLSSGEGASLATHELVHAGQQSVLGSSRPHEHTPEGQHLEAQARSAEHASLAGLELPSLPLAAPAVQRAPVESAPSSPFSPQQLHTLMSLADNPPGNDVSIQRALTETAPPRPSTPAPALPGTSNDGGPAPASGPQTPEEIEELATKLFPTLRNLFRTELLGFRRRSGTSADRPLI